MGGVTCTPCPLHTLPLHFPELLLSDLASAALVCFYSEPATSQVTRAICFLPAGKRRMAFCFPKFSALSFQGIQGISHAPCQVLEGF